MAAWPPYGPEDPLTSLETALQPAPRPGLVELTWNWRWELGLLGSLIAAAGLIAGAVGSLGLDLHAGRHVLAAACWATEVRVIRDDRHAHVVILQVIRKRPAEQRRAGPGTWPPLQQATGDGPGETAERDTRGWPSDIPLAS